MGCAASVRGVLEEVDGIVEIKTDPTNRLCSFRVTKADLDYQSKLDELAKTTHELTDYEIQ